MKILSCYYIIGCNKLIKGLVGEKMKRNQYILDKWSEEIDNYEQLKITEAQDLYKKYLKTEDEELKKSYMNRLVLGTSYVIRDYIKKNNLIMLCTPQFDMEDLISSFMEVWIKFILDGRLLDVNMYSSLFRSSLYTEVYTSLGCSDIEVSHQFFLTADVVRDLFSRYTECRNKDIEFECYDILESYHLLRELPYIHNLIPLFEKMYTRLITEKDGCLEVSKTRIESFLKYFINVGLFDRLNTRDVDEASMEDDIINKIACETLLEDIEAALNYERARNIIFFTHGFYDGKEHTFVETAKKFKIDRRYANAVELNSMRKLYRSPIMQKYEDIY